MIDELSSPPQTDTYIPGHWVPPTHASPPNSSWTFREKDENAYSFVHMSSSSSLLLALSWTWPCLSCPPALLPPCWCRLLALASRFSSASADSFPELTPL